MTDRRFDNEEEEIEEIEEEETEGEPEQEEHQAEPEARSFTEDELSEKIQNRLHRERKKMAKELGMSMEEARDYIDAGRQVSQASGLTPSQIRQRLIQQQQQQGGSQQQAQGQQAYTPAPMDDDVRRELKELRTILTDQQSREKRDKETAQAKQEFGSLYDEYEMDIEDKAEDLGISMVDAAAMVLRPRLKDHYETRTKKSQQMKKRRKVEGSGEGPSRSENPEEVLTPEQIRVAKGMRIPLDKYLKRLREKGEA